MGVPQYLRKASLIVYGANNKAINIGDLRFSFAIRRGDIQTPNSADIRIYNLASDTAHHIQQISPEPEFSRVVINAGYEGNFGLIFDGEIKQVRRGRSSETDTYLDITAADGDSAYNYSVASMSLAAESTSPANQVEEMIKGMAQYGVTKGYVPNLSTNPLPRGKAIYGMVKDELRKIAKTTDTSWSIQDAKVNLVPLTAYMPGEVPVISSATGMIGLPEQTQNGINVRVLLNPNIKVGQKVLIDISSLQKYRYSLSLGGNQQAQNAATELFNKTSDDGSYYVMIADHHGDTRGNDWYTDLTCLAVNADVSPGYVTNLPLGEPGITPIKRYG